MVLAIAQNPPKFLKEQLPKRFGSSLKTAHRITAHYNSRVEIAVFFRRRKEAIKPHDRLVPVG
jgi:hypothetical protein